MDLLPNLDMGLNKSKLNKGQPAKTPSGKADEVTVKSVARKTSAEGNPDIRALEKYKDNPNPGDTVRESTMRNYDPKHYTGIGQGFVIFHSGTKKKQMRIDIIFLIICILFACSENKTVLTYHSNKALKSKVSMRNGRLHGLATTYFENGNLETKGNYKNGLRVGEHYRYYSNGNVSDYYKYELVDGHEKLLQYRFYTESGLMGTDMYYSTKRIEVSDLVGKAAYHPGDSIKLALKLINPKYEYFRAAIGDFDSLLIATSNDPITLVEGDSNHTVILSTIREVGQEKVTGICDDFTIKMINDTLGYTHGEQAYFEWQIPISEDRFSYGNIDGHGKQKIVKAR